MKNPALIYGLTAGEPAGIGAEIIVKSLRFLTVETGSPLSDLKFVIYGDYKLFAPLFKRYGVSIDVIADIAEIYAHSGRFFLKDFPLPVIPAPGVPDIRCSPVVLDMIKTATLDCLTGGIDAMITAPVDKSAIHQYDPNFYGHTDYIAEICGAFHDRIFKPVMMLCCSELRAVPLTVHIPLSHVAKTITEDDITETGKIIIDELREKYGVPDPRLAVCGLNPHAGEGGTLGTEEQTVIIPAIRRLEKMNIRVTGPHAADSLFHAAARKQYDAALCMYHDQALIPVKTLGFDEGVNVTLGLPIRRISPDHGTAYDIAGKNIACEKSFLCAIKEAFRQSAVFS